MGADKVTDALRACRLRIRVVARAEDHHEELDLGDDAFAINTAHDLDPGCAAFSLDLVLIGFRDRVPLRKRSRSPSTWPRRLPSRPDRAPTAASEMLPRRPSRRS